MGRFFFRGGQLDEERGVQQTHPWYLVLWLTGVDYFSTLGYQPGLALLAAGALAVPSTAVLVIVTLFGAVPVYAEVARHSYAGQGSIAMLENMFSGWTSKIVVLILLGFAATDFIITMTLSAADAARHAVTNPYLHPYLGHAALAVTLGLLVVLAAVFFLGFREAIALASAAAIPYLVLNGVVLGRGFLEILWHPDLLAQWNRSLTSFGDTTAILVASGLTFPRLALGLTGFETGVAVMPLVSGGEAEPRGKSPSGRIRATRKLLVTAALVMTVYLMVSSIVCTLLIPPVAYQENGEASGRALAYLAHRLLGESFGSIYDISTIVILWFAGASAMTGMLSLIPRYLPRFGMAPRWVTYRRPMVLVLLLAAVAVTLAFGGSVEAQGGAYATGVLVLMLSAAVAVALVVGRREPENGHRAPRLLLAAYFWVVSLVFAFTLIDNVIARPDGIIVATIFIFLVLSLSGISRYYRSTEMRVSEVRFVNDESAALWASISGNQVNLVPQQHSTEEHRLATEKRIRHHYHMGGPLAFLHVNLLDNRSEFLSSLRVYVRKEGDNFVVEAFGAVAIAPAIAYLSELLQPKAIFLRLTRANLMRQSVAYFVLGEGETGLLVYSILVRYWGWARKDSPHPSLFLMSE